MAANPVSSAAGVTTTSKSNSSKKEKETLLAVLQFLKKNKLPETEKILRQEANCFDSLEEINLQTTPDAEPDISSVLSAYNSDADPTRYEDYYSSLQAFVEKSLDVYKPELAMVLYPMFVHMYLELVYKGSEKEAQSFFACFRGSQEDYHEEDLSKLAAITRREHMKSIELMGTLRSNKFVIRMSKDTYQVLKKHLQDQQQEVLLTLIQQHLHFDVFEGRPRSKQTIEATAGAVTGEATFEGSMAENLVNSIEKKGLENRLRAVEGQIKVLKLEEVAHNEEKVRLRNKVTKVFEEMKSVKEDFEDRMNVMKVFEEMKSVKEDFESIRHDIQDLERALKRLQFLQASNCLGEVSRQLQNNMYQYVFPQSFSPIGNYKVKNIHRDVNQFPNTATGEEKLQARKRWSELQKKLNWNETYEVAVKLLQENGTHQKISFKLLQEAPDILDEQGSLKGPLSRACIDGLIHMWKQFQIVAH